MKVFKICLRVLKVYITLVLILVYIFMPYKIISDNLKCKVRAEHKCLY